MTERKPMQIRLLPHLKNLIEKMAKENGSSQNSEVNRIIREKLENMQRAQIEIERLEAELAESRAARSADTPTT